MLTARYRQVWKIGGEGVRLGAWSVSRFARSEEE
jgi:hypothetical protein